MEELLIDVFVIVEKFNVCARVNNLCVDLDLMLKASKLMLEIGEDVLHAMLRERWWRKND